MVILLRTEFGPANWFSVRNETRMLLKFSSHWKGSSVPWRDLGSQQSIWLLTCWEICLSMQQMAHSSPLLFLGPDFTPSLILVWAKGKCWVEAMTFCLTLTSLVDRSLKTPSLENKSLFPMEVLSMVSLKHGDLGKEPWSSLAKLLMKFLETACKAEHLGVIRRD